jgi:hypothetical protein
MKKNFTLVPLFCFCMVSAFSQTELPDKYNPLVDFNLSPSHNKNINPLLNSLINPKLNWNINPAYNNSLNPTKNAGINPKTNPSLNPIDNKILNPMFSNTLHPQNPGWTGHYLFDKDDSLIGFITMASQEVMLCFDKDFKWSCYFIRSSNGSYNQFTLTGEWTGSYLSQDSSEGYNFFSLDGEWTGKHME